MPTCEEIHLSRRALASHIKSTGALDIRVPGSRNRNPKRRSGWKSHLGSFIPRARWLLKLERGVPHSNSTPTPGSNTRYRQSHRARTKAPCTLAALQPPFLGEGVRLDSDSQSPMAHRASSTHGIFSLDGPHRINRCESHGQVFTVWKV